MTRVVIPGLLLCICFAAFVVEQTTAHCGTDASRRKFAPGEGGRNVTLTVNCSQENATLMWSNGGLPYLQEVTIYSSCINPSNTSEGAVTRGLYYAFFGVRSELDAKQVTVEAFPGRKCSYYGCYERQARARYYTFSTVSCVWTEPAALDLVPSTSYLPAPSSSHFIMLSSVTLPTSIFGPSPTPSAAGYHSDTNGGVSIPVYVWVVSVVLMVFIIIAVAVLMATCCINYDNSLPVQKCAAVKSIFNKEEKIDLDFYPVSTCAPTDKLSIHSDVTVYNWLQTLYTKDDGCEGVDGLEFNQEDCIKEGAKCAKSSSFRPNAINQSLATSDSAEVSNRIPDTSTPSQSTASSPNESVKTIAMEERNPTVRTQSGVHKTPLGYVLEEDVQNHIHTLFAILDKEQTKAGL